METVIVSPETFDESFFCLFFVCFCMKRLCISVSVRLLMRFFKIDYHCISDSGNTTLTCSTLFVAGPFSSLFRGSSSYRLKLKYIFAFKNPERLLKSKPVTAIVMTTRETLAATNSKDSQQKTHVS